MTEVVREYARLIGECLRERDAAGGELGEQRESDWVSRLDTLYWSMTPSEQSEAEERARDLAAAHAAADEEAGATVRALEAHDPP